MSHFEWRGDAFRRQVEQHVADRLERAGTEGVRVAKSLVPVRSGRTRDSIGYTVNRASLTLQIYAGTPWALFIELGTRRMPARPFLRPALNAAGRAFGSSGGSLDSPPI